MLIHSKDDIEFVTEFPFFLGHPVYYLLPVQILCLRKEAENEIKDDDVFSLVNFHRHSLV